MPALARPTPGEVEAAGRAAALVEAAGGERQQRQPNRDVEPEDPVPRDAFDDGAADQRPERHAEARDPRPRADRQPALLGGEGVGQQRQRQRRHHGGADALEGARGDQRAGRRREGGGGRSEREDREADEEHAAAAEAVAERGPGEQQDRVGERVGVDRPLERLDRRAEVLADRGQRVGDDQVVEDDHEEGDRDDREGPEARHEVSVDSLTQIVKPSPSVSAPS
jgi:hypothetical protein